MSGQSWRLSVRDRRGGTRHGVVVYTDRAASLTALVPSAEFRIVLLARSRRPSTPADATALCVPAARLPAPSTPDLPSRLGALRFPDDVMAAYREGAIVSALPLDAAPAQVFREGTQRPDFARLAGAMVDALDAEAFAAYVGTLRHALDLRPGDDAVAALASRLSPDDASQRPPRRAPGIARLHRGLADLREHRAPDVPLEQFIEDLRLLRMFARDDAWPREAMERLLVDVQPRPVPMRRQRETPRVVPMQRRRDR